MCERTKHANIQSFVLAKKKKIIKVVCNVCAISEKINGNYYWFKEVKQLHRLCLCDSK